LRASKDDSPVALRVFDRKSGFNFCGTRAVPAPSFETHRFAVLLSMTLRGSY
jgi:hypothetical protein